VVFLGLVSNLYIIWIYLTNNWVILNHDLTNLNTMLKILLKYTVDDSFVESCSVANIIRMANYILNYTFLGGTCNLQVIVKKSLTIICGVAEA